MSQSLSKLLFFSLMTLYSTYLLGIIFFTDMVTIDMSAPWVEVYGFVSALLIVATVYSHAFSKKIFNHKTLRIILLNTAVCAIWSYLDIAIADFALMSLAEITLYTSLYFIIYPPIFFVIKDLSSNQKQ